MGHFSSILPGNGVFHAIRMIMGLLLFGDGSISGIARSGLDSIHQSTLNRFINDVRWSPDELNERRLDFLQQNLQTRSKDKGLLIIDDSVLDKTGEKIEGTGYHYSNSKKRTVHGHNLVSSHYLDDKKDYPLHFEVYIRKKDLEDAGTPEKFKTKVQMALELIANAIKSTINFSVTVFDSWYFTKQICNALESAGKDWVSRAKINRIVNLPTHKTNLKRLIASLPDEEFARLKNPVRIKNKDSDEEVKYQYIYEAVLDISDLGPIKCVIIKKKLTEEEGIVLVSNRKDWSAQKIILIYKKRWKIETFYRDSKQNLALDGYYLRSLTGIKRYWVLVFLAYSFLQYCSSFGILQSFLDDDTETTGDKVRRFQELNLKSLIDLIILIYDSTGTKERVYQVIFKNKYKRAGKNN